MGAQAALGGEPLAADLAVERPVLHALDLRIVVPQVLLQVRQLDEGAAALGVVALVRPLTWGERGQVSLMGSPLHVKSDRAGSGW